MESVVGSGRTTGAAFTRPNDTTPYTAGDAVSDSTSAPTVITFTGVGGSARGFTILQTLLFMTSANVATKPDLELWLFDVAPAATNDNAAFAPTDAELRTNLSGLVGIVAIPVASFMVGNAGAGAAGNAVCEVNNIGLPLNLVAGGNLFGVLVIRNAYVPVAQEVFSIMLKVLD